MVFHSEQHQILFLLRKYSKKIISGTKAEDLAEGTHSRSILLHCLDSQLGDLGKSRVSPISSPRQSIMHSQHSAVGNNPALDHCLGLIYPTVFLLLLHMWSLLNREFLEVTLKVPKDLDLFTLAVPIFLCREWMTVA